MKTKYIEKLINILEQSMVSEIEITDFWGRKIRIKKSGGNNSPVAFSAPTVIDKDKVEVKTPEESPKNLVAIRSPIVGTFYRAPAPDAQPYCDIGDIVKPGQVVCIVEAMKLMNEIESDIAGKIVKILLKNEEPVEYNQELFLVEPL
jgi:acetyl-CoA carboxylase biotin carboxyl carrier protein